MKCRLPIGRTLATVTLTTVALSVLLLLQNQSQLSPRLSTTTTATAPHRTEGIRQTAASYNLPVRLKIPKINVDAPIDQMGLTSKGDMQAPTKPQHAGWYKFGPRPGNEGSAVIAGHYGLRTDGQVSIFGALHTLGKGDRLYVEDEKGATAIFVVQRLHTYEPNEAAPDVFGTSDRKAHLNLITCQGVWDSTQQTYSNRLVVFSDKE